MTDKPLRKEDVVFVSSELPEEDEVHPNNRIDVVELDDVLSALKLLKRKLAFYFPHSHSMDYAHVLNMLDECFPVLLSSDAPVGDAGGETQNNPDNEVSTSGDAYGSKQGDDEE